MSDIPPTQLSTASVMRPVYLTPCQRGDECAAAANCAFCQQGNHPVSVAATSTPTSRSDSGGLVVIAPRRSRSRSFLKHQSCGPFTWDDSYTWEPPGSPYDTRHAQILVWVALILALDHNQIFLKFTGEKGEWYELADYSLILADPDRIQTRSSIAPCYSGLPKAVTRRGFTMEDTLPDDHSDGRPATPDSEPGNLDAAAKARYFLASRHRLRTVNASSIAAWECALQQERELFGVNKKHALLDYQEEGLFNQQFLTDLYFKHAGTEGRVQLVRTPTPIGIPLQFGLVAKQKLQAGDMVTFYGGKIVHKSVYEPNGIAAGLSHSHARRVPNTDYIMDGAMYASMITRSSTGSSESDSIDNIDQYQPTLKFWKPWQLAAYHASPIGYMMNTALPGSDRSNNCKIGYLHLVNNLVDLPAIFAARDIAIGEELLCPYNDQESKVYAYAAGVAAASSHGAVYRPPVKPNSPRTRKGTTSVMSTPCLIQESLADESTSPRRKRIRMLVPQAGGEAVPVYDWPQYWDDVNWARLYKEYAQLQKIEDWIESHPHRKTTAELLNCGFTQSMLDRYVQLTDCPLT